MYQVKHKLCPKPVQDIFIHNSHAPQLRNSDKDNLEDWTLPKTRTVNYGIETLRYRGPLIWNLIPDEIKMSKSIESFKSKIGNWKPQGCKCHCEKWLNIQACIHLCTDMYTGLYTLYRDYLTVYRHIREPKQEYEEIYGVYTGLYTRPFFAVYV